jgi:beta-glucosidase
MKRLGIRAYRFSLSWPRILPRGRGRVNPAGLDFYSRLVDALLDAGIAPFATLYHWDLPQALQDQGGWTVRCTAEAFVEYADVVGRRLGDRVKQWITHNEPWCTSMMGYQLGKHAPGLRDWAAALRASHHVLLSHAWSVPVLRGRSRGAEVGIALNLTPAFPASRSSLDIEAWRHFDGYFNRWFLDPLHGRKYPADMVADYVAAGHLPDGLSFVKDEDLRAIATPLDFIGVNYYTRAVLRNDAAPESENLPRAVFVAPEPEWTEMGWEVYPDGLYEILTRLHLEYRAPRLYVTENGASYSDAPDDDGRVDDRRRRRFHEAHLGAAHRALQAGVPLAGYFVWSLLDNFEWERGYTQRFGIVWVDFESQRRILKDSASWYARVIVANRVEPE